MKHLDVTHSFACSIRTVPYSTTCNCGARSNATPAQEGTKNG